MSGEKTESDYYSLLNVSRKATLEEIRASYKKLAVTYHPDIHQGTTKDEELLKAAQEHFTQIKLAYETLIDEKKRTLYDLYGAEGVRTGWELASKYASTEEMLREFERIKRKQEERDAEGQFERKGTIQLNVSVAEVYDVITQKYNWPEISGMLVSQQIKSPITPTLMATFGATLTQAHGVGRGSMLLGLHKTFSTEMVGFTEVATTGDNAVFQLGAWRRLSKHSTAQLSGVAHYYGTGLTLNVVRQLTPSTTGIWEWSVGQAASMRVAAQHVMENKLVLDASIKASSNDLNLSISVSKPLSKRTDFKIGGSVWIFSGPTMSVGGTRTISKESKVGVSVSLQGNGIYFIMSYHRMGQKFSLPILVTEEVSIKNAIGSLLIPSFIILLVKFLIVEPNKKRTKQKKLEQIQKENKEKIEHAKKSAVAAIKLMTHSATRKQAHEETRKGLIIVQAWYGNLLKEAEGDAQDEKSTIIDVTIPLQYLVEDSQLHLEPTPKANLLGFYDPCPGEDKQLYIRYLFQDKLHQVTVQDWEALGIPKRMDMQ